MAKPTVLPRFASVDLNNGTAGAPNVVEPSFGKKDSGWNEGERPARETFNWLHRIAHDWIKYFDEEAVKPVSFVQKPIDTLRDTTITLADDPHLTLPVEANTTYLIECLLQFNSGSATPDVKIGFSKPVLSEIGIMSLQVNSATNGIEVSESVSTTMNGVAIIDLDSSEVKNLFYKGTFIVDSSAGNVAVEWSQNVSNGVSLILRKNSYMKLQKVS